jgi:hypothetical protein
MKTSEIIEAGIHELYKRATDYLPEYQEEENPLATQYRDTVRDREMLGTGAGLIGGGLLGAVLGPKANRITPMIWGGAGGGLLGKFLGRRSGEHAGAEDLVEQTGVPYGFE